MKTVSLLFGCAALGLAACAADGMDDAVQAPSAAERTPTSAMPYISAAGASDMYEIESSRLALQKAASPDVRRFAQMMIDHHTQTTNSVTTAARSAGLTPPPPRLMETQQRMMEALQPLSGEAFDRLYTQQQRQAHDMALALHQTYSESGDTPELRQAADAAVPIIRQHIQALQQM